MEFIQQYITTVMAALTIMSLAYLIFWKLFGKKLRNRKIQLSNRAGWPQIKDEVLTTLISFLGSTVFMMLLLSLKADGILKFYIGTGNYFFGYEVVSVIIMLLISDTWFYWSHRIMHHPKIYKYVHALHHKSLDVNPYTSTSFHAIESIWLTAWILPLALVMPISMTALGIVQVLGTFNNLKSHLGYEFFPKFFSIAPFNILVSATNHSLHHTQYNGNYGLFFRFWDIACGTELNTTSTTFTEIHQREDAKIIDNTSYKSLEIMDIVKENSNTVSVYFKPTEKDFYNYKAGQYLTIKVKANGKTHNRCFSISSTPTDNFLRITVKLNGDVSHHFYNSAKIGDKIESLLPVGDFVYNSNSAAKNNYVLVAGGSGVTPLYSMLQQMLQQETQSTVTLLYAAKDESEFIFRTALQQLATQNPNFSYQEFISGVNRIGANNLQQVANTHYFICGPDSLKQGVAATLKTLNVSNTHIHTEHFADGYLPWFGLF